MICEPAEWKRRVCLQGCRLHQDLSECQGPVEAHHIITQQSLRKRGLSWAAWDTRNGIAVCANRHARHTLATCRIPYEVLPAVALEFARELGLEWQIDRYYPRMEVAT